MRIPVALIVILMAALALGCGTRATKGTMPPPGPDGLVDPSSAPDFIAVAGADGGSPGYVPARFLLGTPSDEPIPVYAEDLVTVVGHMVAGRGFVPLGIDPLTVPTFPVVVGPPIDILPDGGLTVYVRNASGRTAWIAVLHGDVIGGVQGYDAPGMGCLDIEPGGRLVRLAAAPQDHALQILDTIYVDRGGDVPAVWLDVASDGSSAHGEGFPSWWSSGAATC